MDEYDYLLKIVIVGDSGVGKSSVLFRYVDNDFSENFLSTIGVDFKIITINFNDKKIKLQIWDTAGQERFKTITSSYYRGVNGVILAYSITDKNSFEHISSWIKEIRQYNPDNCSQILIGNKNDDYIKRQVDYTVAKEFADKNNLMFIETSAKEDINIKKLFEVLLDDIIVSDKLKYDNSKNSHEILSVDLVNHQKYTKCCF